MKLKTQFLSGTIFIIIIISISITYFLIKDTKKILYDEMNEKAKLLLNYLKGVAMDPLIKKDKLNLMLYIKKTSETPGILFINITDHNDIVIASTNQEFIDKKIDKILPKNLIQGEVYKINYLNRQYDTINFSDDIYIKTIKIGSIFLGFDKNYIDDKIKKIYFKSFFIVIFFVITAIFVILFWTNKFIEPLKNILNGIKILSEGNLTHKIKVKPGNELTILANSFNEMSEKLFNYYEGILNAFLVAIDTKDKYTPGHSKRVANYAVKIANTMKLSEKQVENIRIASILKDVGNIGVEREILFKKEILSADDIIKIQKHPEISAKILEHIEALKEVIPIILQHHERYDGKGYPKGLKGNEILIEARILAIADAYDAMITKREHREALSKEEAIYELRLNKGKQFDPEITEIFISILNRERSI